MSSSNSSSNSNRNLALAAAGAFSAVGAAYLLWKSSRTSQRQPTLFGAPADSKAPVEDPVQHRPVRVPIPSNVRDPNSFANFQECVVTHMQLDLQVNFRRQVLSGSVILNAEVKSNGVDTLILDTRKISVQSVKMGGGSRGPRDLEYSFGPEHVNFGSALRITIPSDSRTKGTKLMIQVQYETASGSECSAAQWLPAAQTAGKKHPYFFTQCQAIHCRSLVPCQDAPACKTTYDASITVPSPLVALMSAVSTKSEVGADHSVFRFTQAVPMAPYLIALAVGNLESRDIGPRTRVWSEPSVVEFGAYEFADTERFLTTAEQICGPYVWGRYDLLLLPPSFPYGGMENPCLTFVTPTLLAGDRSLANVVAHEIAHSWSGNLVTNANWENFWMNEGFTVFIERRIIAKLFGEERAGLQSNSGWQHLEESVEQFGHDHQFTRLNIPMDEVDPDDSFSSVPYEKGYAFLMYLEKLVGGPLTFEPFIRAHVQRFQYGTVTVEEWKSFFLEYFKAVPSINEIDWDVWINGTGLPPAVPCYNKTLVIEAGNAADAVVKNGTVKTPAGWSSDQKVVFLEELVKKVTAGAKLSSETTSKISREYGLTETRNSELRFRWCTLLLRLGDESIFPQTVKFLNEQGRMKFVRPLYRDLFNCSPKGKTLAIENFVRHRENYHAIAQKMIGRDLGIDEDEK